MAVFKIKRWEPVTASNFLTSNSKPTKCLLFFALLKIVITNILLKMERFTKCNKVVVKMVAF